MLLSRFIFKIGCKIEIIKGIGLSLMLLSFESYILTLIFWFWILNLNVSESVGWDAIDLILSHVMIKIGIKGLFIFKWKSLSLCLKLLIILIYSILFI